MEMPKQPTCKTKQVTQVTERLVQRHAMMLISHAHLQKKPADEIIRRFQQDCLCKLPLKTLMTLEERDSIHYLLQLFKAYLATN